MKYVNLHLTYIVIYVFAIAYSIEENEDLNITVNPRIVGGSDCSIKNHPYVVSIHINGNHQCGGTVLNHRWVMTAAHCCALHYTRGTLSIVTGLETQNQLLGTQIISVEKFSIHPSYNSMSLKNDICLIKAKKPLLQGPKLQYVKIARPSGTGWVKQICKKGTIMGWGMQEAQDLRPGRGTSAPKKKVVSYNPTLQCATLKVRDYVFCMSRSSNTFGGLKFCASTDTADQDICRGDSGGPFLCGDTQFGIISGGRACGVKDVPGTFVRVEFYDEFIYNTILTGGPSFATSLKICHELLVLMLLILNFINNVHKYHISFGYLFNLKK